MSTQHEPTLDKIPLRWLTKLEKDHGAWIWDGVLYENDSIVNPMLHILPNRAGSRLRRILSQCYNIRN